MLDIKINSSSLWLDDDVQISFVLNNPMFGDGVISGSYSFPFKIPATAENKAIFGWPHRPASNNSTTTSYECEVIYDGFKLFDATIEIDGDCNALYYEATIYTGVGDFGYNIEGATLKDIDMGGTIHLGSILAGPTPYYDNIVNYSYSYASPSIHFNIFPIKNLTFYDGTDNETKWDSTQYVNYYDGGFTDNYSGDANALVPMPYVAYVLRQIFEYAGYDLNEDIFEDDTELAQLVIYNVYCAMVHDNIIPGPTYDLLANDIDLINNLPDIDIKDFLKNLFSLFGACLFCDNRKKQAKIKLFKNILSSSEYVDLSDVASTDTQINIYRAYDGFKFSFEPDGNDDFITDNVYEINEDLLLDPVDAFIDLPASPDLGSICYVNNVDTFFIYRYDSYLSIYGWWPYCYNLNDYVSGSNRYEIGSNIDTLIMTTETDVYGGVKTWRIPTTSQPGGNNRLLTTDGVTFLNEYNARLLFYRGLYDDDNGDDYPLGSSDVYDYDGNVIANYALKWNGDYGLYENFYKDWLYWITDIRKAMKCTALLTAQQIAELDFSKKYMINNQLYLLKSVSVTLRKTSMSLSKLEAYTV